MKRSYNSQRRVESAAQTRQAIVKAAVRLHGFGITSMAAVAKEAGVALATVNKHFPSREDLFRACTTDFAASLVYPSLETLAAIEDPGERLLQVLRQIYSLHELSLGQTWTAYKLADESPTMAQVLADDDAFIATLVEMLLEALPTKAMASDHTSVAGFLRGMLSPLTYRALRLAGGLAPEEAVWQTAGTLAKLLDISLPSSDPPT